MARTKQLARKTFTPSKQGKKLKANPTLVGKKPHTSHTQLSQEDRLQRVKKRARSGVVSVCEALAACVS